MQRFSGSLDRYLSDHEEFLAAMIKYAGFNSELESVIVFGVDISPPLSLGEVPGNYFNVKVRVVKSMLLFK